MTVQRIADRQLRCRLGDKTPSAPADVSSLEAVAWRHHGRIAIRHDDKRLTWPEREFLRTLMERLFGKYQGE